MRIIFYSIIFLFLIVGCQQQEQHPNKELEKEKVLIYIVRPDQSPVQDFTITLSETGESAPNIRMILTLTDVDGKTEANLKVGVTYEAYLVKDDDTTQYEEFTVSDKVEENEFIFVLED